MHMLYNIELVYCVPWNYTDRAVSLAAEILKEFEPRVKSFSLVPGDGGRFEVSVNGDLIYSKLQTNRHAEPGEVAGLLRKVVK